MTKTGFKPVSKLPVIAHSAHKKGEEKEGP